MVGNDGPQPAPQHQKKSARTSVAKTLGHITIGQVLGWLIRHWWG